MWLIKRKYNIVASGVLEGMVDTHSHLLWGVDDGSKDEQRSRSMISALKEIGINKSFTTPHVMSGLTKNNTNYLIETYNKTLSKVAAELDFDIRLAAEYMLDEAFLPQLINKKEKLLSYDGKHLLIEMSTLSPVHALYDIIYELECNGYTPVLAHPERYGYLTIRDYEKLKERGCLFQMNLLSLTESYGKSARIASEVLIKGNMYDFIGSDIHGLNMVDAIKQIMLPEKDIPKIRELIEKNASLWL